MNPPLQLQDQTNSARPLRADPFWEFPRIWGWGWGLFKDHHFLPSCTPGWPCFGRCMCFVTFRTTIASCWQNHSGLSPPRRRMMSSLRWTISCERLIFVDLQYCEVLRLFAVKRKRCIKFRVLRAQDCIPFEQKFKQTERNSGGN